ncbi:MAG: 2Fe-2S iron-sulfur cluster-binding protein, partial [Dehalococcoidales bacterium]
MTRKSATKRISVTFQPDNVTSAVPEKANLLATAIDVGVHINASCGGAGTCGTCKVLIKKGSVDSKKTAMVSAEEYARGIRQACQSRVLSDLVAHIPLESRLEAGVLEREMAGGSEVQAVLAGGWCYNPPLTKQLVKLTPPTMKDNSSDLNRLLRGLRQLCEKNNISVDLAVVRKLAAVLREGEWTVTASLLRYDEVASRLINIEPGDTRSSFYGLAFDIGTTGVRGQLLDLCRGNVLAQGLEYNKQISYGADVISRIACCGKPGGLKKLQKAVTDTINGIISELLAEAGIEAADVGHMVVAGNTTM